MRYLLVITFLWLGFNERCLGQTSLDFEGVYMMENPIVLLVMTKTGTNLYDGYLSTETAAKHFRGKITHDVLEVRGVEGEDTSVSYCTLDFDKNIRIMDAQLNKVTFKRVNQDPHAVKREVEKYFYGVEDKTAPTSGAKPAASGSRYAGKKFLHLYTGNGMTEKWAYYLYADGRFLYRADASYISSNAQSDFSSAMNSRDAGTWKVETKNGSETLMLQWNSGQTSRLAITKGSDGYRLDNIKYFLVGMEEYQ